MTCKRCHKLLVGDQKQFCSRRCSNVDNKDSKQRKQPPTGSGTWGNPPRLAVDHDHVTGKVRGLLCRGCNVAEGLLKGSPLLAYAMADYMIKNGGGE